jgi:GT2 family glycosyltransferase
MWRKSCHERWGYFDEQYFAAGDFDLWLRFVEGGAQFKKVPGVYGVHYSNPKGLSTNESNFFEISTEVNNVKEKHASFLQSIQV